MNRALSLSLKTLPLAAAAFAFATAAANAAPLRPQDVPAGANWLAHFDAEAANAAPAGAKIWDAAAAPHARFIAKVEAETGFNFRKHVTGVTAYGTGGRGQGALVVRHRFDNKLVAAWLLTHGFAADAAGRFTGVRELPHNGGKLLVRLPAAGVAIIAVSTADLDAAAQRAAGGDAAGGTAASAGTAAALLGALKTPAPVFVAAGDIAAAKTAAGFDGKFAGVGHRRAHLKKLPVDAKNAAVAVGAGTTAVTLETLATVADDAQAASLRDLAASWLKLNAANVPALKLAVDAEAEGARVTLKITADAAGVIAEGAKAAARKFGHCKAATAVQQ